MKLSKSILLLSAALVLSLSVAAQKSYGNLYHPEADATKDIALALEQATKEGKHVLLQIGGNWCVWCYRLHDFIEKDVKLKSQLEKDYVALHINYSPDNQNLAVLAQYGYPQRFGFPVLVVLDANGQRLHTQDTGLLEAGDGYDVKKVAGFLNAWSPTALDPASYIRN